MKKTSNIKNLDRIIIESVSPLLNHGRFPIKRITGETLSVTADIYKDGHDIICCLLKYRKKGNKDWFESPMTHTCNDKWTGEFRVDEIGYYEYTIEAYTEIFLSWRDEISKKYKAIPDIKSELLEGLPILNNIVTKSSGSDKKTLKQIVNEIEKSIEKNDQDNAAKYSLSEELKTLAVLYPDRTHSTEYYKILELVCERRGARYAAWYEMFPRSQGTDPTRSATFDECAVRLDEIAAMGFDVVYMPPIHPIGKTNRKGKNNSLKCLPGEPGCPYAIGSEHGGHKSIEPTLGDFEMFERFRKKAESLGIELALDIAIQCSPDHPYIKQHPEWFALRPDGTLKYAENPPKKYEDIHQFNMYCDDMEGLWNELLSIFLFWAEKGVKIFRVDNPHTKPVAFWEWVIAKVKEKYPETIFLAEAFTKPKMMYMLAKAGFTQSYTYFTWRNHKHEITDYFRELTSSPVNDFFTGNLFANTPDILPTILQIGGKPAFEFRAILAATLSSVYGIYNGFELCEAAAIPGKEEYINSEKYEFKVWDWNRPGNIKSLLTKINQIRKNNPALQEYNNLKFYNSDNPNIIFYGKHTKDLKNIILITVNLDPFNKHHSFIHVPINELNISHNETYQVHDLLNDERYFWRGSKNYVEINPHKCPAHIFKICKWSHNENGFDYFI